MTLTSTAQQWYTVSWVVELFAYLERADLDAEWAGGGGKAIVGLGFTTCPSDPRPNARTSPALANVVNSGLPDMDYATAGAPINSIAAGVFHNLHRYPARTVSLDYLSTHDGSTNTVMLSENVQATQWADPNGVLMTPWQAEMCIVWWRWSDYTNNAFTPKTCRPTSTQSQGVVNINAGRDETGSIPAGGFAPTDQDPLDYPTLNFFTNGWVNTANADDFLAYARPSSRHPGGVIMAFCDGHTQFVADTLDYSVYRQIMTPYGRLCNVLGAFNASTISSR
jgi:prepilin-type processing-associated H-X9-DG protein